MKTKEEMEKCKNYPKCKNIMPLEEGYCRDCMCDAFGVNKYLPDKSEGEK